MRLEIESRSRRSKAWSVSRNASLATDTDLLGSDVMPSGILSREKRLRRRWVTNSIRATPAVRCGLDLYASANTETSSSQLSCWSLI